MMLKQAANSTADELPGVMDALYRFGAGVDHNDGDLLATAFSDDAVVDFGLCGRTMGLDFPVLTGSGTIVRFLRANAETQTTSHVVTNGRAQADEDAVGVRALVDATHCRRATIPAAAR